MEQPKIGLLNNTMQDFMKKVYKALEEPKANCEECGVEITAVSRNQSRLRPARTENWAKENETSN